MGFLWGARAPRRLSAEDEGLTLIEVMFAMVIFAMVAGAISTGLAAAMKTARLDKNRVAAANLAARELEITRNEFNATLTGPTALAAANYVVNPHQLPGGTTGGPLYVDAVPYTVTRNVEWLPAGTGKSACDGGSAITYPSLAVSVQVTWPAMGSVPAVTSNTVLTPKKGILSTSMAFVGVKVLNAQGVANSGRTVGLTGPGGSYSDTTAADGCAVFAVSTAGTYAAALNEAGYVDFYGSQNAAKSVVVTTGTLSQLQFSYDRAATMALTLSTLGGYSLPTTLPGVTLANTGLQPSGTKTLAVASASGTIGSLWPFTDGYTVWAGSCAQSDPAAAGGTRSPATVIAPGTTGTATATLAPVDLKAETALGAAVPNAVVLARPVSTTGCLSQENPLTLGTTNASGELRSSVPAGAWQLEVAGRSAATSWPVTPTLLPTSGPTNVTVVVL